jgi:hypothetical protein
MHSTHASFFSHVSGLCSPGSRCNSERNASSLGLRPASHRHLMSDQCIMGCKMHGMTGRVFIVHCALCIVQHIYWKLQSVASSCQGMHKEITTTEKSHDANLTGGVKLLLAHGSWLMAPGSRLLAHC